MDMSSRKRPRSVSRQKIRTKVVMRMHQSVLFRKTEEYHENEMKLLFQKHYKPSDDDTDGSVNTRWALNLQESTLNNLRLHLSWSMGISTFQWDRYNVGHQTIIQLRLLGELYGPLFLPEPLRR